MRLLMPQSNIFGKYVRIENPVVDAMLGLKAPIVTGKPAATNLADLLLQT
jgi:hypothetical protein